jgi:hypothetical protein
VAERIRASENVESEVNAMAKGWCENCQIDNRTGALYCAQCGEELQYKQPRLLVEAVGVAVLLAWLLFAGAWQVYYASGFGVLQNIGVFFSSFAVMLILEAVIWRRR